PLHRSRERERGFNQAELIATRLGRPVVTHLLRRRKNTPSQTGLTRNQRKRNLAAAFETRGDVKGTVIVVDDVYTTGSTMNEIARTLKRAGAERVEVLTVARVANDIYRVEATAAVTDVSRTQWDVLPSTSATNRVCKACPARSATSRPRTGWPINAKSPSRSSIL